MYRISALPGHTVDLIVRNKLDLVPDALIQERNDPNYRPCLNVSLLTGQGVSELTDAISQLVSYPGMANLKMQLWCAKDMFLQWGEQPRDNTGCN